MLLLPPHSFVLVDAFALMSCCDAA